MPVVKDSIDDSLQKKERNEWTNLSADSISTADSSIAFYFHEQFLIQVPRSYKIRYTTGPDFRVYQVITGRDTFGYFLGKWPALKYPLAFLTETDSFIRAESFKHNLRLIPKGKHHYQGEVNAMEYSDSSKKPINKKMYFEIIDSTSKRFWISKPVTFDKHSVNIAIEYKEKNIDRVSHIFGSYKDSTSFEVMLQFANTITPYQLKKSGPPTGPPRVFGK